MRGLAFDPAWSRAVEHAHAGQRASRISYERCFISGAARQSGAPCVPRDRANPAGVQAERSAATVP